MVEQLGVYVRIFAGVDLVNRKVSWTLQALDPATGTYHCMVRNVETKEVNEMEEKKEVDKVGTNENSQRI